MKLVIKGAYYYNRETDEIIVPHYTGEYNIVDCDEYIQMNELKGIYDKSYIDGVRNRPIIFEEKQYYSAEYSPKYVDDYWELLSDLSELSFIEENFDW